MNLTQQFESDMYNIYHQACKEGYTPSYFLRIVDEQGGIDAARVLINRKKPTDGFRKLWELGRLDLSAEALVKNNPRYHGLFSQQTIQNATRRLKLYGYV